MKAQTNSWSQEEEVGFFWYPRWQVGWNNQTMNKQMGRIRLICFTLHYNAQSCQLHKQHVRLRVTCLLNLVWAVSDDVRAATHRLLDGGWPALVQDRGSLGVVNLEAESKADWSDVVSCVLSEREKDRNWGKGRGNDLEIKIQDPWTGSRQTGWLVHYVYSDPRNRRPSRFEACLMLPNWNSSW